MRGRLVFGNTVRLLFSRLYSSISFKPSLVLYASDDCSLCTHFKRHLNTFLQKNAQLKLHIEIRDIKQCNEEIFEKFKHEIPVLVADESTVVSPNKSMLAVHGGVSFQVPENTAKWCADALSPSTEDIVTAVSHLEDHKWFNCGRGSNLTSQQTVECEAGFMTSKYFRFGGVGCVSRLKNPIQVAEALAMDPGISGLIRPQVLVGKGAEEWAAEREFSLCDPEELITKNARKEWTETYEAIQAANNQEDLVQAMEKLDTVGGVAILDHHAEACVSSGGIRFKRPGRLGHCTQMGSGVWADKTPDSLIAVSASGCGEALVWTDFCRSLAMTVVNRSPDELPAQVVEEWFRKNFVNSTYLHDFPAQFRLAGGIIMLQESGCSELLVFHNTPYFPIAFRSRNSRVKALVSTMKPGQPMKVDSFLL